MSTRSWTRPKTLGVITVVVLVVVGLLAGLLTKHQHNKVASTTGSGDGASIVKSSVSGDSMGGSPDIAADFADVPASSSSSASDAAAAVVTPVASSSQQQGGLTFAKPASVPAGLNLLDKQSANYLSSMKTCRPLNGSQLIRAVTGSDCTLIVLTKGSSRGQDYKINRMMNVTSLKVIVGNPIDMGVINATGVERLFNVMPGGLLDLRSVVLYRGGGRSLNNGNLRLTLGGAVIVYLGGTFRATGVLFREADPTLQGFINDLRRPWVARRTFGGMVLVLGGIFTCMGCEVYRFNPYGSFGFNSITVGGNWLVLAGSFVCVGCYNVGGTLFGAGINVGGTSAVLGGVSVFIGGGSTGATCAVGQFGAGQNNFGGGVLFQAGFQDISAVLALMRAGFGQQTVGGGVYIATGLIESRVWGVGCVTNAGQTYAVGGGIFQVHIGEITNAQISAMQAGAGMNNFLGAGDCYEGLTEFVTIGTTFAQYGLGMRQYNGAGTMELIVVDGFSTAVVRVQFILGSESFLGAGFFTLINDTRYSYQVVNAAFGGHEYWSGPGAAVFIRVFSFSKRRINYRTNGYAWVVAGTFINGAYPGCVTNRGCPFFVDKYGVYKLNKTAPDGKNTPFPLVVPWKSRPKVPRVKPTHKPTPIPGTPKVPKNANKKHNPTRQPTRQPNGPLLANEELPAFEAPDSPTPFPTPYTIYPNDPLFMAASTSEGGVLTGSNREYTNSLNIIKSGITTQQASTPDPDIFAKLFHQNKRKLSAHAFGGEFNSKMSPKTYAAIYELAIELTQRRKLEKATVAEDGTKFWPEYVYARGGKDTQCFLCGVDPLPSQSHIDPNNSPLDTTWFLAASNDTTDSNSTATPAGTGAARHHRRRLQVASPPTSKNPCKSSDVCAADDVTSIGDALATAIANAPQPIQLPPGLESLASLVDGKSVGGQNQKAPDTTLTMHNLELSCSEDAGKGCGLSEQQVKLALKNFLAGSNYKTGADSDYKLTAASADTHDAVKEVYDNVDADSIEGLSRRKLQDPQCPGSAKYTIYMTTRDEDTAKGLLGAFATLADNPAAIVKAVSTQPGADGSSTTTTDKICGASLEKGASWFLPATDKPEAVAYYQSLYTSAKSFSMTPASSSAGNKAAFAWPSVMLLSDNELAPTTNAEESQDYNIVLKGFNPATNKVVVELLQGLGANSVTAVATADASNKNQDGSISIPWKALAPAENADGARYFLHAYYENMPGVFAFSAPFALHSSA